MGQLVFVYIYIYICLCICKKKIYIYIYIYMRFPFLRRRKPFRSHPNVVLYGLTELLPCSGFCLGDHDSHALVSPPVPVCYLRSPTGQKGLIWLLTASLTAQYLLAGSGAATTTGTDHLVAPRLVGRLNRHGTWSTRTQCPPPPSGQWLKLSRRLRFLWQETFPGPSQYV